MFAVSGRHYDDMLSDFRAIVIGDGMPRQKWPDFLFATAFVAKKVRSNA